MLADGLNALTRPGSSSTLGGARASGLCVVYSWAVHRLAHLSLLEWTLCGAVTNPPVSGRPSLGRALYKYMSPRTWLPFRVMLLRRRRGLVYILCCRYFRGRWLWRSSLLPGTPLPLSRLTFVMCAAVLWWIVTATSRCRPAIW